MATWSQFHPCKLRQAPECSFDLPVRVIVVFIHWFVATFEIYNCQTTDVWYLTCNCVEFKHTIYSLSLRQEFSAPSVLLSWMCLYTLLFIWLIVECFKSINIHMNAMKWALHAPKLPKCPQSYQESSLIFAYSILKSGLNSLFSYYFIIFQYADSTQVLVTSSNAGSVTFVNSAFWGPSNQIAKVSTI